MAHVRGRVSVESQASLYRNELLMITASQTVSLVFNLTIDLIVQKHPLQRDPFHNHRSPSNNSTASC
jgi:hypothetical protein